MSFPAYKQLDYKDCGPTCLKIIARYYNRVIQIQELRDLCETTRLGSTLNGLSDASEKIGFRSLGAKVDLITLNELPLPCILHWNREHFVVLYKIKRNKYYISDPAHGLLKYDKREFLNNWIGADANSTTDEGIVLLLEPTSSFYNFESNSDNSELGFGFLSKYVLRYKNYLWQIVFGLIGVSIIQLIFPFLTQSIIDVGINNNDIGFIYLILIAQVTLFIGKTAIEVIRRWILLHLSARINISILSDFFIKLMNLPMAFFDSKITGDLLRRIDDHKRLEHILTSSSLSILFSLINLVIFSLVLLYYNIHIFIIFLVGSSIYFFWITIFLKKRRDLDYKRFSQLSQEQSKVIELINGMQEIKLHNAEKQKRWSWEFLQARLFKVSIEGLALEQYQDIGSSFINEIKNILITVLSAKLVIDGEITLGVMLAISYIVGQLNSPIVQLIDFIRELQDAKISLERLSEIHKKDNEEVKSKEKITEIPFDTDLKLSNVCFKYKGSDEKVLDNISLIIPSNKITAIVGSSGSGKTTLMKLLLKFYNPGRGKVKIANYNLENISHKAWRNECGVVMQEGYIFSDTIAKNIAVGDDYIDKKKLAHAIDVANIRDYIENLPLSYNTKIGMDGIGLSTGQKQRLLIARAVYKNPNLLFFDEATSALDATNEKTIMEKLNTFFNSKTVVIIAHRLSTVKNAHQIVVLEKGKVVEIGNHESLVKHKGSYFNLVKNQLELGE